jgi:hypothetical protein
MHRIASFCLFASLVLAISTDYYVRDVLRTVKSICHIVAMHLNLLFQSSTFPVPSQSRHLTRTERSPAQIGQLSGWSSPPYSNAQGTTPRPRSEVKQSIEEKYNRSGVLTTVSFLRIRGAKAGHAKVSWSVAPHMGLSAARQS